MQVPLTVSPFINLPTATTLPYTYKAMPSTLPPSVTGITSTAGTDGGGSSADPSSNNNPGRPRYVVSSSGHAAHPDDIVASCRALQAHVEALQANAESELRALDERIRARELAEKRRVAPGWLDSEARLLEPERKAEGAQDPAPVGVGHTSTMPSAGSAAWVAGHGHGHGPGGEMEMAVPDVGDQLDRAFGNLALRGGRPS